MVRQRVSWGHPQAGPFKRRRSQAEDGKEKSLLGQKELCGEVLTGEKELKKPSGTAV